LFHHVLDDDEGGAGFALLEEGGGEAEARGGVGGGESESAFEEGGGFGEGAGFQQGVGDVDEQRGVIGGVAERGAELGREGGRVEFLYSDCKRFRESSATSPPSPCPKIINFSL
jgi:hypothetical protein